MSRQLTVRGLDDAVVQSLRVRAAVHGRSMESEVRTILRAAVEASPVEETLKDLLLTMPRFGTDADFERNDSPTRPVEL